MRIFMGIVWFVVFLVVLYIGFSIVAGMLATSGSHATTMQEGMQAGLAFAHKHAIAMSISRWSILAASIALAVWGSWRRVLPGTKKKPAEAQAVSE